VDLPVPSDRVAIASIASLAAQDEVEGEEEKGR